VAFYSTQAAFNAAMTNPQATDGFETAPAKPGGVGYTEYPNGYSGVGFTITTPAGVYIDSTDPTYGGGLYQWNSGDVMAYYSLSPDVRQAVDVTFTFAAPVTAFSIDLMTGPLGSTITIAGAGFSTAVVTPSDVRTRTFFGLTSTTGLNSFTMRTVSKFSIPDGAIGMFDNFTIASAADVAPVPEPASWALMIAGFGLAGSALRRRARPAIG
jgi:hypothetical protein